MSILIRIPKELEETKKLLTKNIHLLETKMNTLLLSPTPSKSLIDELQPLLSQCQNQMNEMEIELSSYSQKTKDKYQLSTLKTQFNKVKILYTQLENHHYSICDDDTRSMLIQSNQEINEGNAQITESIRLMTQTNQTDLNTMISLNQQTKIIFSSADLLQGAEAFLKRTNQQLRSMINKAIANKLILIGILFLLVLINIFILYYKLKNKFVY